MTEKIALERAQLLAKEFCGKINRFCEKILVVGSVRRQKPLVHDVDIVVIPKAGGGALDILIWMKKQSDIGTRIKKLGSKMVSITYQGIPIDLYFATPETWWTLVLIRTGTREHNIKMCLEAKKKGWTLHADGQGLSDEQGEKIEVNSEEEFFEKLGLAYKFPEER